MYVATLPFFPLIKEPFDIEKVKPDAEDHDAALSRNLFLRGLQRLHQVLFSGPERHAVYRLCAARRFQEVRRAEL